MDPIGIGCCTVLPKIVPQLAAAERVAQLAQRLGLDLPHALARDAELATHIFQRAGDAVLQPKAHHEHLALALAAGCGTTFHASDYVDGHENRHLIVGYKQSLLGPKLQLWVLDEKGALKEVTMVEEPAK